MGFEKLFGWQVFKNQKFPIFFVVFYLCFPLYFLHHFLLYFNINFWTVIIFYVSFNLVAVSWHCSFKYWEFQSEWVLSWKMLVLKRNLIFESVWRIDYALAFIVLWWERPEKVLIQKLFSDVLALYENSLLPLLAPVALIMREQTEVAFAGYLFLMPLYRVIQHRKVTVLIKAGNFKLLRVWFSKSI